MKIRKMQSILLFLLTCCLLAACRNTPEKQAAQQLKLGRRYLEEQQYTEAIVAFHKAIELDPKEKNAYLGLAEAYAETDRLPEAFDILEQGCDRFPDEAFEEQLKEICLKLAEFYLESEDVDRAIEIVERGLESFDRDEEFEEQLKKLGMMIDEEGNIRLEYQSDRDGQAGNEDQGNQQPDEGESGGETDQGEAASNGSETDEEWEEEYERLAYLLSGDNTTVLTYGEIREAFEPLVPQLHRLIEQKPQDSRGYELLGYLYLTLDRMDECLAIRKEGYEITGDEVLNPEGGSNEMGWIYDRSGGYLFEGGPRITERIYDGWGRDLVVYYEMDFPLTGTQTYTYGEGKRILYVEYIGDAETKTCSYEYDGEGRISKVAFTHSTGYSIIAFEYSGDNSYRRHMEWQNDNEKSSEDDMVVYDQYGKVQTIVQLESTAAEGSGE